MKQFVIFGGAAAMLAVVGCQPQLAQVKYSEEEASWQKMIRANYPGYRVPRTLPPAVNDNTSEKLATVPAGKVPAAAPAAEKTVEPPVVEEEPAVTVDKALDKPADAKPAAPAEEKSDAKTPEVKAPAAADVKKVEPPEPTGSEVYVVRSGDTLAALAKHFYGDSRRQDVIVRANADLIRDPNKLYPGMKLLIPKF